MKVKDLRELLEGVDDDMHVLIPVNPVFDGMFKHPCLVESGVGELGVNENLGTTEESFLLVPCGFFEEHEDKIDPQLN